MNNLVLKNLITKQNFISHTRAISARPLPNFFKTQHRNSIQLKRKMSSSKADKKPKKFINANNINPNYVRIEYPVRGPLVAHAREIEKQLKEGAKMPFESVIRANTGDCHAVGQKPTTHVRQMIACCTETSLLKSPNIPTDVKERARNFLKDCDSGSAGAYTLPNGLESVRRQVAEYIADRDGYPSDYSKIFLTNGATTAIKTVLALLNNKVDGKKPAVLSPIPQYPMYSATLEEYDMALIGYYLDESKNWALDIKEMKRAIDEGRKKYVPRAVVVINPGNPTGQVLTHENVKEIIKFAHREELLILADEVYQDNIYDPKCKFHSFKKTINEMGPPYSQMELISFNSASKSYLGECGLRGGYMELVNIDEKVMALLVKSISAALCANSVGQMAISALVNPPMPGDASYDLYVKERCEIMSSLAEKADMSYKGFNSFEGFSCNLAQGALYAFPQIRIPPKAVEAAKKKNQTPDTFYAFELLDATGVCVVAGSAFKQQPGTYHFRTTILPKKPDLKIMLDKFKTFHAAFMQKYK